MRFFPWPPSTLNGAASLPGGLQNDLPAGDDAQVDDFVERVGEMLEEMEKEQRSSQVRQVNVRGCYLSNTIELSSPESCIGHGCF